MIKANIEDIRTDGNVRNILATKQFYQKDLNDNLEIKSKAPVSKTLLDIIREDEEGDLFIVNTDHELTETIVNTFEAHNCKVTVSQLERDLLAVYVLLDRKMNIKKLRKLVQRGNKIGLDFFLTKTGITTSLMYKINKIFKR